MNEKKETMTDPRYANFKDVIQLGKRDTFANLPRNNFYYFEDPMTPTIDAFYLYKDANSRQTCIDLYQVTINSDHDHKIQYLTSILRDLGPAHVRYFVVYPDYIKKELSFQQSKYVALNFRTNPPTIKVSRKKNSKKYDLFKIHIHMVKFNSQYK